MKKEEQTSSCCQEKVKVKNHWHSRGESSAIYGLGVVGALFYFLQGATTFGTVLMGIGKAIFWPALVIFRLLTDLRL